MGGIAIGLGAFGQAAGRYGEQFRQILESRRHDFANLMQQTAQTESDPDTRAALLQHAADAASGKPMGKVIQDFSGTLQKRVKDEQALHKGVQGIQSVTGQPVAAPSPPPGATPPGQVAGTGGNALPNVAQPASNPLTQPANGGQIQTPPPVGGVSGAPNVEPVASTVLENPPAIPASATASIPGLEPIPNTPANGQIQTIPNATAGTPASPQPLNGDLPPILQDPQAIMNKYMNDPRWSAPVNRPLLEAAMQQELSHNEALRQQADLVENRIRLLNDPRIAALPAQLKAQGYSEYQIPSIIGSIIGAPVPMLPGIGSAMFTPERLTNLTAADVRRQYPGQFDGQLKGVSDKAPVTLDIDKLTRKPLDVHAGAETTRTLYDAYGNPVFVGSRSGQEGTPLTDLYSPSEISPVQTGVNAAGHPVFQSRFSLIGSTPVTGAGTNPGFIPSVSTSTQPGAPPITTTRTKGGGHATVAPVVPPASSGGSVPPVGGGSNPGAFNDPLAKANYENYMAGKGPAPTGRQLDGMKLYAATHNLEMPDVINAAGQKTLATLDPVVNQIDDLTKRLNEVKGKKILPYYLEYQLGAKTPYDDIFTGTAFERLRSGSAALQGIGSRSFPVFNEGMKHTPTFDRFHGLDPDSTGLMLDKLAEAKKIILQERASAIADQKKSGVVPDINGGPGRGGLTAPVVGDPDDLRRFIPSR